jgi:nitroreductase
VPREVLEDVIRTASWAPSGYNTQPWYLSVVTGRALDRLRVALVRAFDADPHAPPEVSWYSFSEVHKERRRRLGYSVLEARGIAREDKEGRIRWYQKMLEFFDAPAAIILQTEHNQGSIALCDMGMLMMALMLSAYSHGLGTCIIGLIAGYSATVRQCLGIPEDRMPVLALAVGYPDLESPVNRFPREREPLENFVRWHED